jgi:hypothetical protein
LLYRLVGRAILAQRDAVVGEHMDGVQAHQCGQPHRRAHVVGEDQEGGGERNEPAVCGHAVGDRPHRVLAHAEMQVATGATPAAAIRTLLVFAGRRHRIEVAQVIQRGLGRGIEVGRTAHQGR